ncbi:hypothetical protein OSTOST_14288, partial [Ostertagia ostertagi]
AASLTLRTVLLSIQALMCSPEPKDPQDAVVAKQYMSNPGLFKFSPKNRAPTSAKELQLHHHWKPCFEGAC